MITEWTMQHDKLEAMRLLGEAGVPCGAVMDSADLFRSPHLRERGMVVEVPLPLAAMPGAAAPAALREALAAFYAGAALDGA